MIWNQLGAPIVGVSSATGGQVRLKVAGQAGVGYHAGTRKLDKTGQAAFTVGPVDGQLDNTGSVVITINKGAAARSDGYLLVMVAGTPHWLEVVIK